ncbi:hypothetical protein [Nocardioides rubriscoriae]|uniref:hypothetical protein n=1 Tax=Nocardioides rubriscoriae TaxID=642762 RepID=UPI0011DF2439|nr:hypothetical protein [Nocardioides rubriscoriae]
MYGDTEVLRRRVDQLREQAVDLRGLADQLVARTESTGWTGRAADSMRVRVTERATRLRGAAAQHETAADSLERHLHEVESQQEAIAAIERRVGELVAEARTRTARTARAARASAGPDPDDVTLCAFEAPPSGHRDWLAVELPGL